MAKPTLAVRFWAKVIKTDGCWQWTGAKHPFGYGMIHGDYSAPKMTASRASWLIHHGDIPQGMYVCHKCDNPECTNPEHLFLGTAADNAQDKEDKGRGLRRLKQADCDAVATLLHGKVALRLLARAFGVERTVIKTAAKYGVVSLPVPRAPIPEDERKPPSPPPILRGEENPRAKVTADDVLRIRAMREQGLSTGDIAKSFSIGKSMVSHICTRRCWKHI